MSERTAIEWCDSTFTPWIGCMGRVEWGTGKPRSRTSAAYWKQPLRWNARRFWECTACGLRGDDAAFAQANHALPAYPTPPVANPARCYETIEPARRRVFCASLADVFDNEVEVSWLADLLSLIHRTPDLDWLLLSKRIGNWRARIYAAVDLFEHRMVVSGRGDNHGYAMARNWLAGEAPANVWLGATICNQDEADRDIPKLLAVPAAKRFLSIEPMLSEIDLRKLRVYNDGAARPTHDCLSGYSSDTPWGYVANNLVPQFGRGRIDWVICGGESGPHARPMHPDWVRSLRDQCAAAGVPFLFKQWGEWAPYRLHVNGDLGGDLRSGRVKV